MIYLLNQQSLIDHWGINGLTPEKKVACCASLRWSITVSALAVIPMGLHDCVKVFDLDISY